MQNKNWVPEIFYEEGDEDGLTSHIPFITVPEDESMPRMLFIFESRDTGEIEPGPDGEELPVTEITLHQYADMQILKNKLTLETYDEIRAVLGLQSLAQAVEAGKQITERVRDAVA